MTIFDILFIVLVLGVGLIAGLVLISRNAFERHVSETSRHEAAMQEIEAYRSSKEAEYQARLKQLEHYEATQPLDDDTLSDTDAPLLPPSDAEILAIEWLSRNE